MPIRRRHGLRTVALSAAGSAGPARRLTCLRGRKTVILRPLLGPDGSTDPIERPGELMLAVDHAGRSVAVLRVERAGVAPRRHRRGPVPCGRPGRRGSRRLVGSAAPGVAGCRRLGRRRRSGCLGPVPRRRRRPGTWVTPLATDVHPSAPWSARRCVLPGTWSVCLRWWDPQPPAGGRGSGRANTQAVSRQADEGVAVKTGAYPPLARPRAADERPRASAAGVALAAGGVTSGGS